MSTSPAARAAATCLPTSLRVLPQRPFAPRPALDKLVALSARHRAGPDPLAGEIGNLGQHGVVAVAFDDRLFEVRMNRRFRRSHETGAEQHTFSSKSQRRRQAAAVGDSAGGENRQRRDGVDHHRHQRQRRHPNHMPSGFRALRHQDVSSGFRGAAELRELPRPYT